MRRVELGTKLCLRTLASTVSDKFHFYLVNICLLVKSVSLGHLPYSDYSPCDIFQTHPLYVSSCYEIPLYKDLLINIQCKPCHKTKTEFLN